MLIVAHQLCKCTVTLQLKAEVLYNFAVGGAMAQPQEESPGETNPPRWTLDSVYPGYDSREYSEAKESLKSLTASADEIIADEKLQAESAVDWLTSAIGVLNSIRGRYENLYAYAYARYATATTGPVELKEIGGLEKAELQLRRTEIRFRNALKNLEPRINAIIASSGELQSYELFIRESLQLQARQLSPEEEDLAADLNLCGGEAWSRLQSTLGSTLKAVWNPETGETKTVTQLRSTAFDPDRETRKKGWQLEIETWKASEISVCAALNGVKGFTHTLNSRRGYTSTLERSIEQSRISPGALDALICAMEESLPAFRGYLKTKARLLGLPALAWYDIFAPLPEKTAPEAGAAHSFPGASEFILKHFSAFSPELADYAAGAISKGWIDAEPREGKVGGAFCISFPEASESRILCNFSGNVRDISTLAHELGHGYHHHVVKDLAPVHQDYPMTLAETASIFAETLVMEKALEELDPRSGMLLMESSLQDSTQVIVDILSRFYFESELMQRRQDHELTPDELCALMLDTQKRTYGDGLDTESLHPYMWAVKGTLLPAGTGVLQFPIRLWTSFRCSPLRRIQ